MSQTFNYRFLAAVFFISTALCHAAVPSRGITLWNDLASRRNKLPGFHQEFSVTDGVTSGFAGIDTVIAGSNAGNTLTGENVASTWSLGATPTYNDGTATLTFANFGTLQGGSGADTFDILANTSANLYGGAGNDSFVFADGKSSTGTIDGQGGTNTLDYSAYSTPVTMNLGTHTATGTHTFANIQAMVGGVAATSTLVGANTTNSWSVTGTNAGSVTGSGTFSFSRVGNLTGGLLNDTFTFSDGASVVGTVNGGSGTNTLDFHLDSTGLNARITATNAGTITGTGGFSSIANLTGGAGNDTFAFNNGKTITGKIDGGGGTNTLDDSAYTTAVRVNLLLDAALGVDNGVNGGIANIQNVNGGSGNDILIGDNNANVLNGGGGNNILVGNGGNDTLIGGSGNDILIGGAGNDTIEGGSGNELMIGSSTIYDNNTAALNSLMAEWSRTDESYATRISHLSGATSGGQNGSIVLNASTVQPDPSAVDQLIGTAGTGPKDWFIIPVQGQVTNARPGETITVI